MQRFVFSNTRSYHRPGAEATFLHLSAFWAPRSIATVPQTAFQASCYTPINKWPPCTPRSSLASGSL